MEKAFVKVEQTASGYLPTLYIPGPDFGDREAYFTSFPVLIYAEEHGKIWAHEQGVEYKEFTPYDPEAAARLAEKVKHYRAQGFDLPEAIRKARQDLKTA